MPGIVRWRPARGAVRGTYETAAETAAAAPSPRPRVAGASTSKAPGATTAPCPLGTIRVTVCRTDGKGLGGARVSIGTGEEQRADRSGRASFARTPPGEYTVSVRLDPGAGAFVPPPPCAVTLGASSTASVTIEVEPLETVRARVRDRTSGAGIPGVAVTLVGKDLPEQVEGTTGPDGVVVIPGVRHGRYEVKGAIAAADAKRYYKPPPLPDLAVPPRGMVELEAEPLGTQIVKVEHAPADQAASAAPVGGATVRLRPEHGGPLEQVTDTATGVAAFEGLRAGTYRLEIDLGDRAARFKPWTAEAIAVRAPANADRTIRLEAIHCQFQGLTVREFVSEAGPAGPKEKAGRTFAIRTAERKDGPGGAIQVAPGSFLRLVAPRRGDLFKAATPLTPLPFNPPGTAFKPRATPAWIELEADAVAHATGPDPDTGHPRLVVQTGAGERVVDAAGTLRPGRCVLWGPDFPWAPAEPEPGRAGRFLSGIGRRLREVLNAVTQADAAPAYWDVIATVCDPDGADREIRVPLAVFPGDQYQLKVNIPAMRTWKHGVNGDYIQGKTVSASEAGGLVGPKRGREETRSASGTEVKEREGDTVTTTGPDGAPEVTTRTAFANLFEADYESPPPVEFTRNGEAGQAKFVVDLLKGVAFAATEMTRWLAEMDNLTPKWGYWVTAEVALLKVSVAGTWGWRPVEKQNEVAWTYQLQIGGTLLELKLGIKAGLEGTVVPSLVYFRAVVYLEAAGSADCEWTWTSGGAASRQQVASTASLEIGVDIVVGNANFCQAKSWVKVPYTFQWELVPPAASAGWHAEFRHGCKDGIFMVARYKLFYGKYEGTRKVQLKQPVDLG